MIDSAQSPSPSIAKVVRWTARVLSVLILLFWGVMIVGHLVGEQGRPSRPLVWADYVILATMGASLAGLALAWKRERAGAIVTLVAVLIGAIANWRVLMPPGALIPLVAMLFLCCGWLSRPRRLATSGQGVSP